MALKFKACKRCKTLKEPKDMNWLSGSSPDDYCFACQKEMMEIFLGTLGYKPIDVFNHFQEEQ